MHICISKNGNNRQMPSLILDEQPRECTVKSGWILPSRFKPRGNQPRYKMLGQLLTVVLKDLETFIGYNTQRQVL